MQKIERYGVIALLFFVITIVAVTFWSDGSAPAGGDPLARGTPEPAAGPTTSSPTQPAPAAAREVGARELPRRPVPGRGLPVAGSRPEDPRTVARVEPGVPLDPAALAAPREPRPGDLAREAAAAAASPAPPAGALAFRPPAEGAGPSGEAGTPPFLRADLRRPPPPAERSDARPPRAEAAPPARVPAAQPREVEVGPGDTLARLARRHLGHERHWQALADANGITDPRRLAVGTRLRLPAGEGLAPAPAAARPAAPARRAAPAAGTRTYTVQRGEFLGLIAQRECGSVQALGEILALNPGLDPDRVEAGREILLPAGKAAAPRTESLASSSAPPSRPRNVVH